MRKRKGLMKEEGVGISEYRHSPVSEQKKIATETMKMNCEFARVMGGMDHVLAARIVGVGVPKGCNCQEKREGSVRI